LGLRADSNGFGEPVADSTADNSSLFSRGGLVKSMAISSSTLALSSSTTKLDSQKCGKSAENI
jgi:hypothetical protein